MPTLMIGAHRPAVPDVQRPVIGGNAVGGLGPVPNEMAARTALKPSVSLHVVYTHSPYGMRFGSSDYHQYPRGGVAACDPKA